ncbi:macrophage erythroblast attacher [Populus alba x Populus x berolinensis]|nr:macrophage erythroblast attacher [Populus alba x Populus x berolinensis]
MEMDSLPNGNSTIPTTTTSITTPSTALSSKLTQLTEIFETRTPVLAGSFRTLQENDPYQPPRRRKGKSLPLSPSLMTQLTLTSPTTMPFSISLLSFPDCKLEEGSRTENLQAQRCRARIDHLESADAENLSEWNNTRMKRILVDYMLRMSYYDTGLKLAERSDMLDLVDIDVFLESKRVIDALQKREVAPALAWCADNKSRLKKSKVFFEPKQWDFLVEQFKQEFCRLYGMTLEPLLNIFLQAGLSALKTPHCYEDDCTKEDPLSQESFRKLALPLPFSKQHHSKLVCYITKELMDTENPPQVLPNGYVYSTKALEEMAKRNDGKITCPRTGLVCNYSEVVKAYIS